MNSMLEKLGFTTGGLPLAIVEQRLRDRPEMRVLVRDPSGQSLLDGVGRVTAAWLLGATVLEFEVAFARGVVVRVPPAWVHDAPLPVPEIPAPPAAWRGRRAA